MLAALNFMTLILSRLIRQMLVNFFGIDSKGLYQRSGKEKESCCLVFPSSSKNVKLGIFTCSRATTAKKCTKKRDARAKLWCC